VAAERLQKRGTVYIAPAAFEVPEGRMVDPATSAFWVSWQGEELFDDDAVVGAEAAVAWGRDRAEVVFIRLGHTEDTYFSAGSEHPDPKTPTWPPSEPPAEGWFVPTPSVHDYVPRERDGG